MSQPTSTDLAVKHRPRRFEDVIGQRSVVRSLRKVIAEQSAHAFMLTGPSGVGKTTLARIIASELGVSPENVSEIDAASNSGVDDTRRLTERLRYRTMTGSSARMVIIDEAHSLSKSAWQALLKPIEEPPSGVYWAVVTTEPEKVPQTIRTRCASYRLLPVPSDEIESYLRGIAQKDKLDVPNDVRRLVASRCEGSPRRALRMLSQCVGQPNAKSAARVLREFVDEAEAVDLCRALMSRTRNDPSWAKAMALVNAMGDVNPESVRITVFSYFSKVAAGAKSSGRAAAALDVMQAFAEPYPSQGGAGYLLLSLARVLIS